MCSPAFARKHADRLSSPEGLIGLPLMEDETGRIASGLPTWTRWFAAAGCRRSANRGLAVRSLHMALMGALNGQGVALGLTPLLDMDLAAGRLVRLFDIAIPSAFSFWLVCKPERRAERKIGAFRGWMAEETRKIDVGVPAAECIPPRVARFSERAGRRTAAAAAGGGRGAGAAPGRRPRNARRNRGSRGSPLAAEVEVGLARDGRSAICRCGR